MRLDAYQDRAVRATLNDLTTHSDALLVAPTGTGKTLMMATILRALFNLRRRTGQGTRALVLQHTVTLFGQNRRELESLCGAVGLSIGYVGNGKARNLARADITVATSQTLGRAGGESWLDHLRPFDVVVIDEAHHAPAPQYAGIFARLKEVNPAIMVLGLTATPERADGKGLGQFSRISHQVTWEDGILAGRIVPPHVLTADLDSAALDEPWADGDNPAWSETLRKKASLDEVVRQHLMLWQGRPGVYFCAGVEHASDLADAFAAAGLRSASVNHEMKPKVVQATLDALGDGALDVVTNPAMLAEGFNCPRISLVGLTRGFASKMLLCQVIGRGLRAFPGKSDCLVLDFVRAVPRHGDILPGLNIFGRDGKRGGDGVGGGLIEPRPVVEVSGIVMREVDALGGLLERVRLGEVAVKAETVAVESVSGSDPVAPRAARTRKEALALGLTTYFTGKPCKHGHVANVFSRGRCVECTRLALLDPRIQERRRDYKRQPKEKARSAARYRNPENRLRAIESARRHYSDPENWAKKLERDRLRRQDPEFRAKQLERERLRRQRKKLTQGGAVRPGHAAPPSDPMHDRERF